MCSFFVFIFTKFLMRTTIVPNILVQNQEVNMKFEENQNVEDAFKASIHESIAERKAAICDT